ncbi:MAG TPA: hypothetical protein VFU92_05685 [Usitatibacter sp.]|jgi:hypothetical protein|nr:hypothetical protein [Usitatibacter sp.]
MTPHDTPDPLAPRLAGLRAALQSVNAPAALDDALTARFRRQHAMRRPSLWWMPPLALAATVALVTWMLRGPMPRPVVPERVPVVGDGGPFLALKPLERIALEPGTTVVATEFPRALLADWGLPVAPDRAGEPVRAEMLYSADGEALAVRLLN